MAKFLLVDVDTIITSVWSANAAGDDALSGHYPPLTCIEVKRILKTLGFAPRPQKSTSHEQWVKENGTLRKVTVDCPKSPFTQLSIGSMARQAGVSKQEFYAALNR